jgi:peptide chain release factor subunit 1
MATVSELSVQLDRLAAFESGPYPVISLYLNLQADEHGRDRFDTFVRTVLPERIASYPPTSPERSSLDQDAERIRSYLDQLDPAVNGLALFASTGRGLFEALSLATPVDRHQLYISDLPHLYPLARLVDEYPRHAVLVADSDSARILVIAANNVERVDAIDGAKTRRHKMGGWSQSRYQRHIDNSRAQHLKEACDALTRIVRDEQIPSVILGGDSVVVARLKEQLPKDVLERLVDVVRLDVKQPAHTILQGALDALQRQDGQTDRERVEALLDGYRGGGLATVGIDAVKRALEIGQAHELVIAAQPDVIAARQAVDPQRAAAIDGSPAEHAANELVVQARQTGASIRFIEDPELLKPFGGVGAFLRFTL